MSDPVSVYIHIPFCVKKCVYCDFYSETRVALIHDYVNAVQKEIEKRSVLKQKVNTIYFGGGTPSLVSVKAIDHLMQSIAHHLPVSQDAEVTFEVNPGTVDFTYLRDLKQMGVNRLSIGVQSFSDEKLTFLKRIHTAAQAVNTIENAKKAGFDNISIDLIYGIPHETENRWMKDLEKAVTLIPEHLSCYMLTIEPGTPLNHQVEKGLIQPPGRSALSALFKETAQFLDECKYDHYEISNFSNSRQTRSRHNSAYWNMTPYHGFGAAAHSYDGATRSWNVQHLEKYIKEMNSGRRPVQDRETLTRKQKMLEMIMLRLRTQEGLDLDQFESLFNISFKIRFKHILNEIIEASFGDIILNRFSLTLEGKTRLNSIVEGFSETII